MEGIAFIIVFFGLMPAAVVFCLCKFARLWLWSAPIIATVLGTALAVAALGPEALLGEEGLTWWELMMPAQQLIALALTLGVLTGLRWGGSLGLAIGGAGLILGLMPVAATGIPFLLYPVCILLFAAVLILSFTGKARRAWEEYRQGR